MIVEYFGTLPKEEFDAIKLKLESEFLISLENDLDYCNDRFYNKFSGKELFMPIEYYRDTFINNGIEKYKQVAYKVDITGESFREQLETIESSGKFISWIPNKDVVYDSLEIEYDPESYQQRLEDTFLVNNHEQE